MSDEVPKQRSATTWPLRVMAGSVVLFLLSIPLCGMGGFNLEGKSGFLAEIGVAAFFLSIPLFLISIVWLVIAAIMSGRSGPPPSIRPGGRE